MTFPSVRSALVAIVLFTGGCETYQAAGPPPIAATPMDGTWASTDGVFVATFGQGKFTSRFTATNEILAQGTYTVAGSTITMDWISVATQQRRAAACSFMASDTVSCNQAGGGKFELRRSAA